MNCLRNFIVLLTLPCSFLFATPPNTADNLAQEILTFQTPLQRLDYLLEISGTLNVHDETQINILSTLYAQELEKFKQQVYEICGGELVDSIIDEFWSEPNHEIENDELTMEIYQCTESEPILVKYKPYRINAHFEGMVQLKNILEIVVAFEKSKTSNH